MNKVISINLNGNAYQLEEGGFEALRAYLDTAARRLEGNPDKAEIIADIEQAIAGKFRSLLGANKTVVVEKEVEDIIAEMGPVEDASGAPETPPPGAAAPAPGDGTATGAPDGGAVPRRLFRIHEGAKLGGVCNGLAAYFDLDVTLVRIAFAFLIFAWGSGLLLYILMWIILPSAGTPAEMAAAHGAPSATAQEFIRRAREGYYGDEDVRGQAGPPRVEAKVQERDARLEEGLPQGDAAAHPLMVARLGPLGPASGAGRGVDCRARAHHAHHPREHPGGHRAHLPRGHRRHSRDGVPHLVAILGEDTDIDRHHLPPALPAEGHAPVPLRICLRVVRAVGRPLVRP